MSETDTTRGISVQKLIEKHLKTEGSESWKLPPFQRTFEWDSLHIKNLADALLQKIYIGTIITGQRNGKYYDINPDENFRQLHGDEEESHFQIIDGQQRCISILATFGGEGWVNPETRKKEFLWINLGERNRYRKEYDIREWQKYMLHWISESDKECMNNLEDSENRKKLRMRNSIPQHGWIRLDVLYKFVLEKKEDCHIFDNCNKGTSAGCFNLGDGIYETLKGAIRYLSEEDVISVHNVGKCTDADVSRLFIAINTSGVSLNGTEVFFSGLKMQWENAEEHLKLIIQKDENTKTILSREDAIRLVVRCAMKEKYKHDPVRFRLQSLSQAKNIGAIKEYIERSLLKTDSQFVNAIWWADEVIKKNFHYASSILPSYVILPVMAWSYRYSVEKGKLPDVTNEDDGNLIEPIVRFVFWATVLSDERSRKQTFERETFKEAWEVGGKGKKFPYENLIELCFGSIKDVIPGSCWDGNEDKISKITYSRRRNQIIFLSLFQEAKLEDLSCTLDVDHIMAYNYASPKLKSKKSKEFKKFLNYIGNLALIDSSENRRLQDKPPSEKFKNDNYAFEKLKCDSKLEKHEKQLFISTEESLNAKRDDEAAKKLEEVVLKRTRGIWDVIIKKCGDPPIVI
jgi:hypothetical protein